MARLSLFTLVFAATVAQLFLLTPGATALQNVGPHRRAPEPVVHLDLNKRMLRKRMPQDIPPIGAAPDPSVSSSTDSSTSQTSSRTNAVTPSPSTSTTPRSASTPTNSQSSSSSSTSSSVSSTSTPVSSTSAAPSSTSSATQTTRSSSRGQSTVVLTATASSTETPPAQDPNNSFLPKSAIVGLIVAGSCIAAGAAIWTVIRKWKFSPSRQFEDRLEPINWEPTQSSGLPSDKDATPLSRVGSQTGHSRSSLGDGTGNNMSATTHVPISMTPDFPPAHDFTAGPTTGYVNMYRGPSPAPPSAYGGQYETPNPYDAYDYNNAAYGQRRY